ncbi:hypothetical protein [Actinokineospora fastidiosa]|uniref:hypothetical protein n=1 Tax=Actinokineospora fastidiosa TaxID=1816 RepID=UPI00166F7D0B|nr:hypothetical protein [Actinokineospora fastidiosa]
MSGRKRIYVDEGEWNRLRRDAGKLAEMRRDVPRLIERVREQTQRDIDRSMDEVRTRQNAFEQAVSGLSENTRRIEQETARRLRATADTLRAELDRQGVKTEKVLSAQRRELRAAIDAERGDRVRRMAELDGRITALRADQDRAAELARAFVADAEILCEQVRALPHERYLPGRLGPLEARLATARGNDSAGIGAYGLSGAQELCQSLGELRMELEQLDQEWRTCRAAAERELLGVRELIAQNTTVELNLPDAEAPDVDHWSRGALSRLAGEVDALLAQVRADDQAMTTEALMRVVSTAAPDFEQRLESVVSQAVTAMHASQLRTNLAELIADALDEHHHYEVAEAGFSGEDQRAAFLAKTVHHASGSEIVIEVEPGPADAPPTVRLHNFDADNAAESERAARTRSIRDSVLAESGIELSAEEDAARPDETKRDVRALVTETRTRTARASADRTTES